MMSRRTTIVGYLVRLVRGGRLSGRRRLAPWATAGTLLVAAVTGAASTAAVATTGPTSPLSTSGIAQWRMVGSYVENSVSAGEGLATVTHGRHRSSVIYRGILTVPKKQAAQGWTHIGDPDSAGGDVIDAFQGPDSRSSKMFLVTPPSGATVTYVHKLVAGELYNNSFATVSPDTQWMVSGEWETMRHLQIYPTPLLNHRTPRRGGALRLAGYIKLDHKVNDVQGCDFITKTALVCASDDGSQTLFANEKPLLEVKLSSALSGRSVRGHVIDLGSIPQQSACSGSFEAEGVDYDVTTGILRVEIIQPSSCIVKTTVYRYARRRG